MQHVRECLEIKVSDFEPFFLGYVKYMARVPEILTNIELKIRDRNASILTNANVLITSGIIYAVVEGAKYLTR